VMSLYPVGTWLPRASELCAQIASDHGGACQPACFPPLHPWVSSCVRDWFRSADKIIQTIITIVDVTGSAGYDPDLVTALIHATIGFSSPVERDLKVCPAPSQDA